MSSISVLYMSMSLDGYIAGPNDEPDNPGGDGFMRLHEWYGFEGPPPNTKGTGWGAYFMDEGNATGAVLAGRRTVEQVDHWGGDHHGVPIFVPSHRPPGPSAANYPLVTYVNDGIASAMAQAKAAGGRQERPGARCIYGTTSAGGWCAGRAADPPDPGAVRRWPSAVRGVAVAHRVGDRSGDRHAGGHPHPLPRASLSCSASGLLVMIGKCRLTDIANRSLLQIILEK